jgi:hypothetical protein
MPGPYEAQSGLDVLRVDRMHYERGMLVKLGRIAFSKLFVLRVAGKEDISSKSSCKGVLSDSGASRLSVRCLATLSRPPLRFQVQAVPVCAAVVDIRTVA